MPNQFSFTCRTNRCQRQCDNYVENFLGLGNACLLVVHMFLCYIVYNKFLVARKLNILLYIILILLYIDRDCLKTTFV